MVKIKLSKVFIIFYTYYLLPITSPHKSLFGEVQDLSQYCSVKEFIIVGEDKAKGKGQKAKGKDFNEIFFLHSKF